MTTSDNNVHALPTPEQQQAELDRHRLVKTIAMLERRQGERRLFMAEIQSLYDRRQREIDNLKAQLEDAE
jgi:hypothetical protein